MPRVEQTAKLNLTSYSGLALIGQCFDAAQVGMVTDPRLPVSQGMKASDMVKAMTGLLSLGMSKVPRNAWMRQRLDAKAEEWDRWAAEGRGLEFICKWNPRKQDQAIWVAQVGKAGTFRGVRLDKRVGLLDRVKTGLQEIMHRAAKFVAHAGKLVLDFGRNFADHVKVFVALQDRLLRVASP